MKDWTIDFGCCKHAAVLCLCLLNISKQHCILYYRIKTTYKRWIWRACWIFVTSTRHHCMLTLILLTWRIWWAPNNASRWQMEFNSAFKGLMWQTHDQSQGWFFFYTLVIFCHSLLQKWPVDISILTALPLGCVKFNWSGPERLSRYSDSLRAEVSGNRIPVGGGSRFYAPVHTGPGAHPSSYTMGTVSFSGVKRQGRGVDHPPRQAPRLKEEKGYTSALGLHALL